MTVAIIDYGVGNLRSVQKAFEHLGHAACVTSDPGVISRASHVVLPGVGAFGAAADTLRVRGLEEITLQVARSGRPFLGICVGMQLLFEIGEENGEHRGLGLISGRVRKFPDAPGIKIPQIGWNALHFPKESPLFANITEAALVYFVHSYFCDPETPEVTSASTEFTRSYTSAVSIGNIHGVQFHPEKSGSIGLRILDNFAQMLPLTPIMGNQTRLDVSSDSPLLGPGEAYA